MIDIKEVLYLFNNGESAEAEKELRIFFDICNGFICKCGKIGNRWSNTVQCPVCNRYKKDTVVYQGDDFKKNLKELYESVFGDER